MTGGSGWGGGGGTRLSHCVWCACARARTCVRGHVRAALRKASTLDPNRLSESFICVVYPSHLSCDPSRLSESLSESLIRVRVAGLMKASMQAVAHLHSLGRIHRDIKVPIHTHTRTHTHTHTHTHTLHRDIKVLPHTHSRRPSVLARSRGAFACAVACFRVSCLSRDPPVT